MYKYEVEWYEDPEGDQKDCGIVFGETIGAAVDEVSDYYGGINIISIKVIPLEDDYKVFPLDEIKDTFKAKLGGK